MSLIKTSFQAAQIGNETIQLPNAGETSNITPAVVKKLTSSPAEERKVNSLIEVLKTHGLTFSLACLTHEEAVYLGAAEYPKNYFCKRMIGGSWNTIVLNKHFALIIGEPDNLQFVFDGKTLYTTAGTRNATRFLNLSFAEQAKFLADVKVQMPLL
jgi:hypothetical protein